MADLFEDKAQDWDSRPLPAQISDGVVKAIMANVTLDAAQTVMDFGAGTGLIGTRLAPCVKRVLAVDISRAMLDKLMSKPEAQGKIEAFCQDILEAPLAEHVDLIVSAMAMHHVEDTAAMFETFSAHLNPGGQLALADLDTEAGDFHPPGMEGVYHHGFDRAALSAHLRAAGFSEPRFVTACEITKEERPYSIFLVMATKT